MSVDYEMLELQLSGTAQLLAQERRDHAATKERLKWLEAVEKAARELIEASVDDADPAGMHKLSRTLGGAP